MKKGTLLLFSLCLLLQSISTAKGIDNVDGYPCCNFSIGANISSDGQMFGNLIHNPAQYGHWLAELGDTPLRISKGQTSLRIAEFQHKKINRSWPFVTMTLEDPLLNNIIVDITVYAPLGLNDDFNSSLPVIMTEMTFHNNSKQTELTLTLETGCFLKGNDTQNVTTQDFILFSCGNRFIAWCKQGKADYQNDSLTTNVTLASNETKQINFLLGVYEDNARTAQRLTCPKEITEYACRNWEKLKALTKALSDSLPKVSDETITQYLRWHMIPAVILTKNMKDGNVLTMGYSELNQRDSYWTSFAHLLFWPDLEKKMILESIQHQRDDGKIPTTILPLIERNDDIDITCYFILRAARYYKYYKDTEFLQACYPAMKKCVGFLESLDQENAGMPQQHSFWADWKDVNGIKGRKYAPHMAFIYLAAIKELQIAARTINLPDDAKTYQARYARASALINAPVEEGGLWNGRFYQQTWFDADLNKSNQRLLQDQVVGIIFDVIPSDRAQMILTELESSMTPYGVAETKPYYPADFGYQPGTYHNGGVWPFLNYIHSWALMKCQRKEEGINLMKKCAAATLENNDRFLPYEYLNSINGGTGGHCIQGWNADFLAAVYFGILDNPWNELN